MEDDTSSILSFQDLEEDALSLYDLSPPTFDPEETSSPCYESSFPSPFEFSVTGPTAETTSHVDTILFCGKAIPFQKPRYLQRSDSSFKRLLRSDSSFGWDDSGNGWLSKSGSLHLPSSKAAVQRTGSCRYNSHYFGKKYKAVIGVTKFPSRLDMGEIKKRQNRQAPPPLFPAGSESREIVLASEGGKGHGHWGLFRVLKSRHHLMSSLARTSLGCIRRV